MCHLITQLLALLMSGHIWKGAIQPLSPLAGGATLFWHIPDGLLGCQQLNSKAGTPNLSASLCLTVPAISTPQVAAFL